MRQGALDHLARVDAGTVDGAVKQRFERQHPMLGIEEQAAEYFMRLVPQQGFQVIAHRLRAFQRRIATQLLGQVPAGHFQHRLQLGELRRPQPQALGEGWQIRLQQSAQAAEIAEQMPRQIHRALPGHAGTQENRQQFGVGQGSGPLGQ
ncbi:hypothetical protein D9M68_923850 [compost metagenome]